MTFFEKDQQFVLNSYQRLPIEVQDIRGSWITTTEKERYLDLFSGVAVNNLGYDEGLVEVLNNKMKHHLHLSNYFADQDVARLAELLIQQSFPGKVFFANSGAEANECALKLVKKWGKINDKTQILSAVQSFHGRTTGTLALTGQAKYQQDFRPLLEAEHFVYNDAASLRKNVSQHTAAVFVEIVQGESGVIPMTYEFANVLEELHQEYGFLLVVDEIQTAMRRCGNLFAYQGLGLQPDLMSLAKSIGGGLPLGAVVISKGLEDVLQRGDHGSTFGGNPVACAGGVYLMERLLQQEMEDAITQKSNYLMTALRSLKQQFPAIVDVRGKGLMIGIEVDNAQQIKEAMYQEHILINITGGNVIRLLPPLTIEEKDLTLFVQTLEKILENLR